MNLEKKCMNVKEVSAYLAVPTKTVYEWSAQGVTPSVKIRGRVIFIKADIDDLISRNRRDSFGKGHYIKV